MLRQFAWRILNIALSYRVQWDGFDQSRLFLGVWGYRLRGCEPDVLSSEVPALIASQPTGRRCPRI
jgi:hypothetical protein